ncbi:unnamed protein product [Adineta steineri]|uniref:Potassium channel domain-containing protein n=2 Tax=Adineta steineri TaxID=433720 RepID=A0A815MJ84_9BILA|nr:unnamed protein product [Adineta steineri]
MRLSLFTSLSSQANGAISSAMTSIVSIPNSSSTTSVIPLLKIVDETANGNDHDLQIYKKRTSPRTVLMADISRRLLRRKLLHNRLYLISDIMCFLGLLGIILMIINNEIIFLNIYDKSKYICWFIKLIITITTIILVVLVFYFRRLELDLYAINNSFNHWRIGLTTTKICLTIFEAFICIIHPIPLDFPFISHSKSNNSTISNSIAPTHITMDVTLGLPMFARLYLICRFLMFNSHLVRDAISQSIGSLNQVSINFKFLLKTYIQQWPARCLFIFCLPLFLTSSWSLRACNYKATIEHISMLDAMWLFIVTFTTVGYGDLTPTNYCGRSVAGITAMIGLLSTAFLVSVLSQKLKLSRSEKYVHIFVLNMQMLKERKNHAANIIKFIFKLWLLKKKHQPTSNEYIKAQRELVRSMHFNQQLKLGQKKLVDSCIGIPELVVIQRQTNDQTCENTQTLAIMKLKMNKIEEQLGEMNHAITNIQNTLHLLLNRISQ